MNTRNSLSLLLFTGGLIFGMTLGLFAMLQDPKASLLVESLTYYEIDFLFKSLLNLSLMSIGIASLTILLVRGICLVFLED